MRYGLLAATALSGLCFVRAEAHDVGSIPVTWNREISRLVYSRCLSCHRPGGSAFSLLTYGDAQPRANAIKDAVLSRRMPPWGAVKGFGSFRNDVSLAQEQIELISRWVDGGIRRGNNPNVLPKPPVIESRGPAPLPAPAVRVSGAVTMRQALTLDGLLPEKVPAGRSIRIVAVLPDRSILPMLWLHDYSEAAHHPFLFRKPLELPAGTRIDGVPADAVIALIPVAP